MDERDGNFTPGGYQKLFQIDISAATDVGPNSPLGRIFPVAAGGVVGRHVKRYTLVNALKEQGSIEA